MTSLTQVDIEQMRDQVFFEGPERNRRLSRYWLLLLLSALIATAGVVSDSTAVVIGTMIIAPLMTPILGVVLGFVAADWGNLRRCLLLLAAGAAAVVALSWLLGHLVPYSVIAATNSQVAARVTPRLVDLVAILASGIVVMARYRVGRVPGPVAAQAFRRPVAVVIVVVLLGAALVPLWINSDRVDKTTIRQSDVQAVADQWASDAGWSVIGVAATGDRVLVNATGPRPAPDLGQLPAPARLGRAEEVEHRRGPDHDNVNAHDRKLAAGEGEPGGRYGVSVISHPSRVRIQNDPHLTIMTPDAT